MIQLEHGKRRVSAVFLVGARKSKKEIKEFIQSAFGYDLSEPMDKIRKYYQFDGSCRGNAPQAITAFLESNGFEDAVRKAVYLGGDSDTIVSIAGGIEEAYDGGIPCHIKARMFQVLDNRLKRIIEKFGLF